MLQQPSCLIFVSIKNEVENVENYIVGYYADTLNLNCVNEESMNDSASMSYTYIRTQENVFYCRPINAIHSHNNYIGV